ncbi:hypothetical protein [Robertmurraya kyonggiensis]|uniref:Integral membrane protein n=1 Tax=Robertmurraya kyonggiensis TaxID=1037680 RepID=A0A4U1D1L4_9BACI|nr:hypothetical protein [Robertmurraya kyonggiensis]TKC14916.1 hypothetical protein FA727_20645 [Robertmurraya kyonggiensis]
MITFFLEHKIAFLIVSEVIFWVFVVLALLFRYWFRMKKASFLAFIILILEELAVFFFGVLDYIYVGTFSSFQVIIVIFILYGIIFGKSDFKKLDRWIKKKVAHIKGETLPIDEEDIRGDAYGKEHAKQERRNFYGHFLTFIMLHIIFAILFGYVPESFFNIPLPQGIEGISKTSNHNPIASISNIWTKILIVDFIWSFSYTIFPKKEK